MLLDGLHYRGLCAATGPRQIAGQTFLRQKIGLKELHMDESGQQEPVLLLDVSTQQGA